MAVRRLPSASLGLLPKIVSYAGCSRNPLNWHTRQFDRWVQTGISRGGGPLSKIIVVCVFFMCFLFLFCYFGATKKSGKAKTYWWNRSMITGGNTVISFLIQLDGFNGYKLQMGKFILLEGKPA